MMKSLSGCWCKKVPNYICTNCDAVSRWRKIPERNKIRLLAYNKMLAANSWHPEDEKRKLDLLKILLEGNHCITDIPLDPVL